MEPDIIKKPRALLMPTNVTKQGEQLARFFFLTNTKMNKPFISFQLVVMLLFTTGLHPQ